MAMADRRIVVGMDGSLASREALRWAARLVRVLGGRIVVAHALEPLHPAAARPGRAGPHYVDLTEVLELEWCRELVRAAIPFSTLVRAGDPVDVVPGAADLHQASLLVVGNRGTGTTPALGLGGTSRRLLGHGGRPVLVTPEPGVGSRHLALRHIVVSLDGSAASERALETVSDLAVAFGSRVTLVRALGAGHHGQPRPRIDARLPRLARRLSDRGIAVRTVVRGGEADEVVRAAAASVDADLVAVGAGPTSTPGNGVRTVVDETHRPTLVAPSPAGCHRRDRSVSAHPPNLPPKLVS